MEVLAQAVTEGGVASNPVSDAFYNLLPILLGVAAAVGLALQKRIREWAGEKQAARTDAATADVRTKQDHILSELADIKARLGPTEAEKEAARAVLADELAAGAGAGHVAEPDTD